jgi:hypothetical protein
LPQVESAVAEAGEEAVLAAGRHGADRAEAAQLGRRVTKGRRLVRLNKREKMRLGGGVKKREKESIEKRPKRQRSNAQIERKKKTREKKVLEFTSRRLSEVRQSNKGKEYRTVAGRAAV